MSDVKGTVRYDVGVLTTQAYEDLRREAGWHRIDSQRAHQAIAASCFVVSAVIDGRTVGCGRVVGDGVIYFYVQDLLVAHGVRRKGIGTEMMRRIMSYIESSAPPKCGAFVALMAAPGLEAFYSSFGFLKQPENSPFLVQWRNGH